MPLRHYAMYDNFVLMASDAQRVRVTRFGCRGEELKVDYGNSPHELVAGQRWDLVVTSDDVNIGQYWVLIVRSSTVSLMWRKPLWLRPLDK